MTLDALIMLSGALVAFLSVAGFPPSIYKPLFFILGVIVIGLGIVVRRMRGRWETAQRLSVRAPQSDASGYETTAARHEEEHTHSAV